MEDITNKSKELHKRLDELNKKMDYSLFEIKKVNDTFKQITFSYNVPEKKQETFAGNPVKLIKATHYR